MMMIIKIILTDTQYSDDFVFAICWDKYNLKQVAYEWIINCNWN